MLFLSNVDKAQVILLSSGLDEQPESVQFGGSLVKVSCYTTVETVALAKDMAPDISKRSMTLQFCQLQTSYRVSIYLLKVIF